MKSIAKIICCGVALAWMCSATAGEDAADTTSDAEGEVTETTSAAGGRPPCRQRGAAEFSRR